MQEEIFYPAFSKYFDSLYKIFSLWITDQNLSDFDEKKKIIDKIKIWLISIPFQFDANFGVKLVDKINKNINAIEYWITSRELAAEFESEFAELPIIDFIVELKLINIKLSNKKDAQFINIFMQKIILCFIKYYPEYKNKDLHIKALNKIHDSFIKI